MTACFSSRLYARAFAVVLCSIMPAGCAALRPSPQLHYDFSRVDERLNRECASGEFSGIVVVRVRDVEVYNKTCGTADVADSQRILPNARFKIYSISKLLTALAVMRLVEMHSMELDAPVVRYIPDLPQSWSAITVKQLLQHTHGLPDLTDSLLAAFTKDHRSAMRIVLAQAERDNILPATPPGTKWNYSNFGYELLADAAAHAVGKPFDDILRDLVLRRGGMRDAVVDHPMVVDGKLQSAPDSRLVKGYNGAPGALTEVNTYSFVQLGAGAVFATIDDMLALDHAIERGDIVSKQTWKTMTESRVETVPGDTTRGWGLGVRLQNLDGVRMQTHSGGTMGYISNFVRYPDYKTVQVVLSNRGFVQPGWIANDVAAILKAGSRR